MPQEADEEHGAHQPHHLQPHAHGQRGGHDPPVPVAPRHDWRRSARMTPATSSHCASRMKKRPVVSLIGRTLLNHTSGLATQSVVASTAPARVVSSRISP